MLVIRVILALLLWGFLLFYVLPNILTHPWHTLALIVAGIAVTWVAGAGDRLLASMNASPRPGVRRVAAGYTTFMQLVQGDPPYNEGRWWIPRTLAQIVFWGVMLAVALAVLVALGGVLTWLDQP